MKPIKPQLGQESVWDYPRPPRLELSSKTIKIICAGQILVTSSRAFRVLETSHPPSYYIPPEDINLNMLRQNSRSSYCEFKGEAAYYDLATGQRDVAWFYPVPTRGYADMASCVAFYPSRVTLQAGDGCFVDDELVIAQAGNFYGGWITNNIVGPFKGELGTQGW